MRTPPLSRSFPPLALLAALAGCDGTAAVSADAGASPNASILPAPLATEAPELADGGADAGTRAPLGDAGARRDLDGGAPPPETMHPASPLPADAITFQKDAPGVTLDAAFRWRDVPTPPRAPEVSANGIQEALKVTALTLKIDLAEAGRMRAELIGSAFPLPAHSELRARTDHYGNLLLWPGGHRIG